MHLYLFVLFAVWRVFLFLSAFLGSFLFPFKPRFPYADIFLSPSGMPSWFWSFANFDGVHYLTIAAQKYAAQFTQVFFPVFPLILGILENIFYFLPPLFVALTFSNLIFLGAVFMFNRLLVLDLSKSQARWIFLFMFLFPTSFYFGSLYTEGLFLLLVLTSFYLGRKGKFMYASFFAAIATATRLAGIFLLPALLYEWHLKYKKNILLSPVIYIAPMGLLAYMFYLYIKFADPLYFWHAQPAFGGERSGSGIILLPQVFWRYLKIFTSVPLNSFSFWIPVTELAATLLGILMLYLAGKKGVRISYLLYSWPSLLLPTLTGTLSSMPRYILVIFPVFIVLGLIKSAHLKVFILACSTLLLFAFTVLFTRGFWVA